MPHQCTKCSKVYPDAAEELLKGCECGARFFYYIRQEKFDDLKNEMKQVMTELEKADKDQIEKDIRELTGLTDKPDEPVILDLESVRVIKPGKFEIDIVNLFAKNQPLIYKLGEGKYIIDIASSLGTKPKDKKSNFLKIVNREEKLKEQKEQEEKREEEKRNEEKQEENISNINQDNESQAKESESNSNPKSDTNNSEKEDTKKENYIELE